jgi:hypothetical protein
VQCLKRKLLASPFDKFLAFLMMLAKVFSLELQTKLKKAKPLLHSKVYCKKVQLTILPFLEWKIFLK